MRTGWQVCSSQHTSEGVSLNQLPSSVVSTLVRESVSLDQLPSSVVSTLVRESVSLDQQSAHL